MSSSKAPFSSMSSAFKSLLGVGKGASKGSSSSSSSSSSSVPPPPSQDPLPSSRGSFSRFTNSNVDDEISAILDPTPLLAGYPSSVSLSEHPPGGDGASSPAVGVGVGGWVGFDDDDDNDSNNSHVEGGGGRRSCSSGTDDDDLEEEALEERFLERMSLRANTYSREDMDLLDRVSFVNAGIDGSGGTGTGTGTGPSSSSSQPTGPGGGVSGGSFAFPHLPPQFFHSTVFQGGTAGGAGGANNAFSSVCGASTYQYRLVLAADYIRDALHRRPLQIVPYGRFQRFAQCLNSSGYWDYTIVVVILGHMALGFFENPTDSCADAAWVTWFEIVCQFFYVADIVVGVGALGVRRYCSKGWNVNRVLINVFMLFNWFAASGLWCNTAGRPMRSLLLISRVAILRQTIDSMAKSVPKAAEVFIMFAITVLFYALLGQVLFNGLYFDLDVEFDGAFDSFGRAVLAMFVLSTTENYPFVMYPALNNENSSKSTRLAIQVTGIVFFMSYVMLVVYILLALFQAALYNTWRKELEVNQLKSRVEMYNSLLTAYHVILDDSRKLLTLQNWKDLVVILQPDCSEREVKLMFMFMDTEDKGAITLKQFVGGAAGALTFDFAQIRNEMAVLAATKRGDYFYGSWLRPPLKRFMRTKVWRYSIYLVVVLHTILMIVSPYPMPSRYEKAVSALLAFSVVEIILKIVAYPLLQYWRPFSRFDFLVIVGSVVVEWVLPELSPDTSGLGTARAVSRCIRVLRLVSLSRHMRQLTTTVGRVRIVVFRFFIIFVLLIYTFASVALIVFKGNLPPDYDPNMNDENDDIDVLDPKVTLNTLPEAMLALFQMAVTNNWQDVMFYNCVAPDDDNYMNAKPRVSLWASLFFVVFYIIVVWFGTNIMGAVIIDAYVTVVEAREREDAKIALERAAPGDANGGGSAGGVKRVVSPNKKLGHKTRRRVDSLGTDPNDARGKDPTQTDPVALMGQFITIKRRRSLSQSANLDSSGDAAGGGGAAAAAAGFGVGGGGTGAAPAGVGVGVGAAGSKNRQGAGGASASAATERPAPFAGIAAPERGEGRVSFSTAPPTLPPSPGSRSRTGSDSERNSGAAANPEGRRSLDSSPKITGLTGAGTSLEDRNFSRLVVKKLSSIDQRIQSDVVGNEGDLNCPEVLQALSTRVADTHTSIRRNSAVIQNNLDLGSLRAFQPLAAGDPGAGGGFTRSGSSRSITSKSSKSNSAVDGDMSP